MQASLLSMLGVLLAAFCVAAAEPIPGKQVEQRLDVGDGQFIEYLLYLPEDYDSWMAAVLQPWHSS